MAKSSAAERVMTPGDDSRAALAPRRFPATGRALRGLWRVLVWGFWLVYFSFVVLVLVLRYGVLPHIEDYRPEIERLASRGLGQRISIGRVEASWDGIHPDLTLLDVRVADAQRCGRVVIVLRRPMSPKQRRPTTVGLIGCSSRRRTRRSVHRRGRTGRELGQVPTLRMSAALGPERRRLVRCGGCSARLGRNDAG